MSARWSDWLNPKYQQPGDEVKALMKDHWAVPFWGSPAAGPTGVVFFRHAEVEVFLSGNKSLKKSKLTAVLFHGNAKRIKKRAWLDELGVSAVREDCSRTRVACTLEWVPLLREGHKPFGLIPNMVCRGHVTDFYVLVTDFKAHVFGDKFTLAQRREYAKKLGVDVGLVEPLKGKPK
jgi:hypothetical protein